jgi:multiple sugar transport system substrate-binding protein
MHDLRNQTKGQTAMKLRKRKIGAVMAGVAVTTVLLTACSTPSPGTGTATTDPTDLSGSLQMSYWGSSTRVEKTNKIIPLFNAEYPKLTVQPQVGDFTTYFQKLNVQAASKTMPCITGMQTRQLNDYTSNGTLAPLDDLMKSGQIDVSDIPKTVLDSGKGPDGKQYMIPYGIAWNSIMVNQAMQEQYGITPLSSTYSWDDYEAWLKEAKEKLPEGVSPTDTQGGDEAEFSAYVIGNGEKMFGKDGKIGFDKSTLTDYWNMWEKFREEGLTNSPEDASDEPTQIEQSYVVQGKVLSEQTAGNALNAANLAAPDKKLTTLPFATGSSGLGNMFFTSGWSIPAACNNIPGAAAFIDFWTTNDEAATIYSSDNGAVANSKQLQAQIDNPATPAIKKTLEDYQFILDKKVPAQTIPPGYNATFEQSFLRSYQDVMFGRKSVAQAVDSFFDEANASLGKK